MDTEKKWLVRSGNIIRGPLSAEGIIEQLRLRELFFLDEVMLPDGFWHFIKDEPQFQDVLMELEAEQIKFDESLPGAETAIRESGQTVSIKEDKIKFAYVKKIKEKKGYAVEWDSPMARSQKKLLKWFLRLSLFVVFLLGSYFFYQTVIVWPIEKSKEAVKIRNFADQAFEMGDYKKALKGYENVFRLTPDEESIYYNYTLLLIHSGQVAQAQRVVKHLEGSAKAYLEVLLKAADGELDMSLEEAKSMLKLNPQNIDLRINKAALMLRRDDFKSAALTLLEIIGDEFQPPSEVLLLFAEAQFVRWFHTKNKLYLEQGLKILSEGKAVYQSHYAEVSLAAAYFAHLIDRPKVRDQHLKAGFDVPLDHKRFFKKNLFLYPNIVNSDLIGQWCLELARAVKNKAKSLRQKSYCFYRSGRTTEALDLIHKSLRLHPNEPIALAILSYLFKELGQLSQSAVELKKSLELNDRLFLSNYLKASSCEYQDNFLCSTSYWERIYRRDSKSLYAILGYIKYALSKNKERQAREFLARGVGLASDYKPFLRIQYLLPE